MPIDPAKPFDLHFTVTPNYDGLRLDRFVKAMVPSMSRTKIQKYVALGRVLVNGAARENNWVARLNDEVTLLCREPENTASAAPTIAAELTIIYEDDSILAINKPAGLVVHPVGRHRHDTLLNGLYHRYRDVLPPDQEVALANRLDQYTSGIILVAKDTAAKRLLQEQFESRRVRKTYYALTQGLLAEDRGTIDLPLGPADAGPSLLQAIRHDELGKAAQTEYEVMERFPRGAEDGGAGITFVKLHPRTGRQHQLRVHLAAIGHPLIADQHYGDGVALTFAAHDNLPAATVSRYALHAAELIFPHPATGAEQTLTAPLAEDMTLALRHLRAAK
jgi:23S rRNA pseudouridine1911/1915/1917 synthase